MNELLHEIKRIENHRVVLSQKKIQQIYQSLSRDLEAFLGDAYIKYGSDGKLSVALLQEKSKYAWFLGQIDKNCNEYLPQASKEIQNVVNQVYRKCYDGMIDAVKRADADELKVLDINPNVFKSSIENEITKLTLPSVLEKHRNEIVYEIKQTLNIGMINGERYDAMAKSLRDRLDISYGKANNIIKTETHRNIESGFLDAGESIQGDLGNSGLIYAATWRTMRDERVRPNKRVKTKKGWKTTRSKNGANHIKMEGQTVKVGELFNLGNGVKAKCPGQSGVAAHDCRCRCFLEYNLMTAEEFAKATGRKAETVQPKQTEKVTLQLSDYPEVFTKGAEGKNTQKLIDYVNGIKGADPNAVKLYASMGKLENISSNGIPFKISHGKNNALNYRYKPSNHQLADVKLNYPKLKGDNIAGQVNTTLHEQMHLLDMYGRNDAKKYGGWFSSTQQPLIDAFRGTSDEIGEDISELFKKHNTEYEAIRKRLETNYKKKSAELKEKYLPNGMSPWEDYTAYKNYEKEIKKLRSAMEVERDYESRNIMGGGICSLQDIYDALSKGTYRANGTVIYGHGQRYYAREGDRIKETVANYVSLSVTRPDLIEMLHKDKPELCQALDEMIVEFLAKAGAK